MEGVATGQHDVHIWSQLPEVFNGAFDGNVHGSGNSSFKCCHGGRAKGACGGKVAAPLPFSAALKDGKPGSCHGFRLQLKAGADTSGLRERGFGATLGFTLHPFFKNQWLVPRRYD